MLLTPARADFDARGEQRVSLNGEWFFRTDPDAVAEDQEWFAAKHDIADWDTLPVPSNWDTVNRYAEYVGRGVYRRSFETPRGWRDGHVRLRFGAVYQTAWVYLNGQYLGRHEGGYTPFEFSVDDLLVDEGENTLTVIADNTYNRGAWWNWGGISRDVTLVRNTPVRIVRQHVHGDPNLDTGAAQVEVRVTLANDADVAVDLKVTSRVSAAEEARLAWGPVDVSPATTRVRLGPYKTGTLVQTIDVPAESVKLWHFDLPYLYACETSVTCQSESLHAVRDRFGIRRVEVKGEHLLLNGEPIRANGFNRIADHRAWGATEPAAFVRRDADLLKESGCVFARLQHTPLSPDLLDYLDEIGMLVVEEIPVWSLSDPQVFEDNPTTREWLRDLVHRDYNHPCVVGWSVGNELGLRGRGWRDLRCGPQQFAYVRSMFDYVRSDLDATRLLTYVSFTAFREEATRENDPATLCDVVCVNCYGVAPDQIATVRKKWPDKPIFIAEFGKGQVGLDPNTSVLNGELFDYMDALREDHDYVIGWSWWSFNDYRSRYRGTPPSQNRGWGFYNVWRQPKRALRQLKPHHAPVRELNVVVDRNRNHATVTLTPRRVRDIPSYVLRGHRLRWEVMRFDGSLVKQGVVELPDVKPGGESCAYEMLGLPPLDDALSLRVSLVTATGHTVHEATADLAPPVAPRIEHAMGSDGTVRVEFSRVPGARGYQIYYQVDGKQRASGVTLNTFVDVSGLKKGEDYEFGMVSVNDAGTSQLSETVSAQASGPLLSPVVWRVEPLDDGFMVGYAVSEDDKSFTLELTAMSGAPATAPKAAALKGAVAVRKLKPGRYLLRIRRDNKHGRSQWSRAYTIDVSGPQSPTLTSDGASRLGAFP